MNERIKQLEKQCWQSTQSEPYALFDVKKFAELIVRECAEVGSKFSQAHPLDIQYQIKRHFGVEL